MTSETVHVTTTIAAAAEMVFGILADPTTHAAIDGTHWVRGALDEKPLTRAGQVFRVAMYHENHPDGNYEIANKVEVFEPPRVISWKPGYAAEDGSMRFGGWVWRYDLNPISPSETEVTLSYDWSAVSGEIRQRITFPPFGLDHLRNSLGHLAELAMAGAEG